MNGNADKEIIKRIIICLRIVLFLYSLYLLRQYLSSIDMMYYIDVLLVMVLILTPVVLIVSSLLMLKYTQGLKIHEFIFCCDWAWIVIVSIIHSFNLNPNASEKWFIYNYWGIAIRLSIIWIIINLSDGVYYRILTSKMADRQMPLSVSLIITILFVCVGVTVPLLYTKTLVEN